jgi:hypothetical protein
MKRAGKIVMIIGAVGYSVFALLWMIMILMTLFRGDASVYYDATYGYFALIFKFVRASFYLGTAVLTFILFAKKEHPVIKMYVYVFACALFVMDEIFSGLNGLRGDTSFIGNYVPLLITLVYFAGTILYWFGDAKNEKKEASAPAEPTKESAPEAKEEAKPMETSSEPAEEKPVEKPEEKPVESIEEKPAEQPQEKPVEPAPKEVGKPKTVKVKKTENKSWTMKTKAAKKK